MYVVCGSLVESLRMGSDRRIFFCNSLAASGTELEMKTLPERIYATWPEFDEPESEACLDAVWKDPAEWLVAKGGRGRTRTVGVYRLVDVVELSEGFRFLPESVKRG
jgi:hypothetical protein